MTQTALREALAPMVAEIRALRQEVHDLKETFGERLISQQEAATIRKVSTRTIRQWVAEGRLAPVNTVGQPRYLVSDVLRA